VKRCGTCRYYFPVEADGGYCHREPPWLTFDAEGKPCSTFAPVAETMWCGEWWLDFSKIFKGFRWEMAKTG
jgi:hypothetical protein